MAYRLSESGSSSQFGSLVCKQRVEGVASAGGRYFPGSLLIRAASGKFTVVLTDLPQKGVKGVRTMTQPARPLCAKWWAGGNATEQHPASDPPFSRRRQHSARFIDLPSPAQGIEFARTTGSKERAGQPAAKVAIMPGGEEGCHRLLPVYGPRAARDIKVFAGGKAWLHFLQRSLFVPAVCANA